MKKKRTELTKLVELLIHQCHVKPEAHDNSLHGALCNKAWHKRHAREIIALIDRHRRPKDLVRRLDVRS